MPSDLQITNIRDQANATSAITIGSDGQITVNQNNPTLTLGSNATFPTKVTDKTYLYPAFKEATAQGAYNQYATTVNLASGGVCRVTGIAPTGVTSVVTAHYIYLETGSASGNAVSITWNISSNGNQYDEHALAQTEYDNNITYSAGKIRYSSILNIGSSPNRFEDLITADDTFGLRFEHGGGGGVQAVGVKITWRF